jgi:hypothetical protein
MYTTLTRNNENHYLHIAAQSKKNVFKQIQQIKKFFT